MKLLTYHKQQGVASLLTAVVLLVCITLVVLFTSKSVLMDTKITADNVRAAQAAAAAQAAMDQGVAYALAGGLDQWNSTATPPAVGSDGNVDYTSASPKGITLTSGSQTTTAQFYFDNSANNPCDCATGNCFSGTSANPMDKGRIVAQGWSDDGLATRTISQCIGTFNFLRKNPDGSSGPPGPLFGASPTSPITGSGNVTLVNRFSNTNIIAGNPTYSIAGASLATYLGTDNNIGNWTLDQLLADIPANGAAGMADTRAVSNGSVTGNGPDIIIGDNTLGQVSFESFFSQTMSEAIADAEATKLCFSSTGTLTPAEPAGSSAQPCTGTTMPTSFPPGSVVISDGTSVPPSSADNPVIWIVNSDNFSLGSDFNGIIYCTGSFTLNGNIRIVGSLISQGSITAAGNPEIIYRPFMENGGAKTSDGKDSAFNISKYSKKGVVAGSWRDW